jgi:pimeloyl-ACP methyl ester carboxylesterase
MVEDEDRGHVVITETVAVDDCAIRFELHGEGVPLVYTPGAFYSLESSRLVANALVPLGYQVLLWDRPNTGRADLLFEPVHMLRLWADKLAGLLDHLGISSAYFGGVTNGLLASLYSAVWYPARVRGLILVAALEDDPKWWRAVAEASFLRPARIMEEQGMAAALALGGGQWGVFDWPDQFRLAPGKREQLMAMDPAKAAATLRVWAASYLGAGLPWAGGLTRADLAAIDIPAIVFSGPGEELETFPFHSADDARRLHEALPASQLVISSEYLNDVWADVLDRLRPAHRTFEPLVAALAGRIDEFIRAVERHHHP